MVIVRPAVSNVLGLEGSLKDGPWSYRICSLVIMTPLYSAMLVVVGVSGMVLRPNHFVLSFEFCFSSMLSLITISLIYEWFLRQTVFGRHTYFRHFAVKMFSRFGIPPELMDKNFHKTAKNFRKY